MLFTRSIVCWFVLATVAVAQPAAPAEFDVCVYGATPGGIAAAISAAKQGQRVILLEPTNRIGGLVTSGLSHTDFHSFESLTGSFLDFAQRVETHYIKTYGIDSPQLIASFNGTFAEPKVNLLVFEAMLAEQKNIEVKKLKVLQLLPLVSSDGGLRITKLFAVTENERHPFEAKIYIDASYEGDLLAAAGVPFHVGREGRDKYGESLAPEAEDQQLQAYNFRWCMTKTPANRVTPVAPPGYQREDFVGVLEVLNSGKIERVFGYRASVSSRRKRRHCPTTSTTSTMSRARSSGCLCRARTSLGPKEVRRSPSGLQRASPRSRGTFVLLAKRRRCAGQVSRRGREWGWCRMNSRRRTICRRSSTCARRGG